MQEQSIFIEALEKGAPSERAAFLDQACAANPALRQRMERLLQRHEQAGSFLEVPAGRHADAAIPGLAGTGATGGEPPASDDSGAALDFLAPAVKPESLGRLSHYDVLELVGRGGMGIVLRAFDEKLHRVVAIKVLAPALATSATARQRFVREAQATAVVCHENVVTVHAVDEEHHPPYLVMQYIDGISLQKKLNRNGPLTLKETLRIGMQIAAGLAAAHKQGLVHRDIKPANILLENHVERVKITDFGLARAIDETHLTNTGVVAGTPQYMAPEQAGGEAMDQRADLFSLGSVLYALCTGRPPFAASSTMGVLKRVCEDRPHPIRDSNSEVPSWLVEIIAKLMAKDPAQRYQSAQEVADLLGQHLAELQQPESVTAFAGRQRTELARHSGGSRLFLAKRRWVVAAAALLLIVGGLSLTEAAGVTRLAPAVIRIVTGEGTLVVEVDDPAVEVTIEGDGGLTITGAGPKELRLRPGQYRWHALKDGKTVGGDLVTVTRSGKKIVTVKVDESQAAAPVAPPLSVPTTFARHIFTGHTHQVGCVAYSPKGSGVVSGGMDGTIRHWDVETGKELRYIKANVNIVYSLSISPDGRRVLAGGNDGSIRLWDLKTGEEVRRFKTEPDAYNQQVAFSPDGRRALAGASDAMLRLYDVETGKMLREFPGHTQGITSVAFSPDGRRALSGSADWTVRLWNLDDRQQIHCIRGHTCIIRSVAFAPDGRRALSSAHGLFQDGKSVHAVDSVRLWDLETGKELRHFETGGLWAQSAMFSRGGRQVLAGVGFGLQLWEADSGREIRRFEGHSLGILSVALSPDDRFAVSSSADQTVRLWRMPQLETGAGANPFAILASAGIGEQRFATLNEAVDAAVSGDTIEIRGNGPFIIGNINSHIPGKKLIIRAGAGFEPVIQVDPESPMPRLLFTGGSLVLEGLEIQRQRGPQSQDYGGPVISCTGSLHMAHCRFIVRQKTRVRAFQAHSCDLSEVVNCQFLCDPGHDIGAWMAVTGSRIVATNNILAGENDAPKPTFGIGLGRVDRDVTNVSLRLDGNTILGRAIQPDYYLHLLNQPEGDGDPTTPPFRVEATANIFDVPTGVLRGLVKPQHAFPTADAFLKRVVSWRERGNLYPDQGEFLEMRSYVPGPPKPNLTAPHNLAAWQQYWGLEETGSLQGNIRYQGGNLPARLVKNPESLTPEHFRLTPGSAGKGAGPGHRDLGAEVDLVGPGPAYERWKKTPAYQQWRKKTGQE